jgi:hypothetical protein
MAAAARTAGALSDGRANGGSGEEGGHAVQFELRPTTTREQIVIAALVKSSEPFVR